MESRAAAAAEITISMGQFLWFWRDRGEIVVPESGHWQV
jgi:hypothetical protein